MTARQPIIVVGLDGSANAEQALHWAARYARSSDGSLVLVSTWEWPTFEGAPIVLGDYDPRKSAKALLQRAAATTELPADRVSIVVERGSPAKHLLEHAKHADLLVLGSGGMGGFSGMVLGSVSSHCAHHSPCPVVIVPATAEQVETSTSRRDAYQPQLLST